MKAEVIQVEKIQDDYLITVEFRPGFFGRLFGRQPYSRQYRGDCTVWHEYPSGMRCSIWQEMWFSNVATAERWAEESIARFRERNY